MIGERIKRARMAAGLSQRAVAERAELSAMAISKFERGEATPTSQTLIRLARALGTRTEFFLRPDTVHLEKPEYRKRASLSGKRLLRIEADILDQVERFLELARLFPTPPIQPFALPSNLPEQILSFEDVELAALAVREAWQLGHNAIFKLADTLEEHGVLVLVTNADTDGALDGLATTVGGFPVIVVSSAWPGDRQRFTMAHELGHLILADRLEGLDEEKACNRFAGAFLVPRNAVIGALGAKRHRLEPRELHTLKHEYGMSMMGWMLRARDVSIIDDKVAVKLFKLFSARGWAKEEPGDPVPPEAPRLFEQLVLRAMSEDMISTAKGAEFMGLSMDEFRKRLSFEGSGAAARQ